MTLCILNVVEAAQTYDVTAKQAKLLVFRLDTERLSKIILEKFKGGRT